MKEEQYKIEDQSKNLEKNFNFNQAGIFFFVPESFEALPIFGENRQQQILTILALFQKGILVEGFYKTIIPNNDKNK